MSATYADQPGDFFGQCAAQSKQTGRRCRRHAAPGFDVCRYHGAATPTGSASPHYKTGEHSRYAGAVPRRLRADYERYVSDRERLLESNEDIAVLLSHVSELLRTGGVSIDEIFTVYDKVTDAMNRSDQAQTYAAWAELRIVMEAARTGVGSFDQIVRSLDLVRKLRIVEIRRATAAEEMMNAEQVHAFMGAVSRAVDSVIARLPDDQQREARTAFAADVRGLMAISAGTTMSTP